MAALPAAPVKTPANPVLQADPAPERGKEAPAEHRIDFEKLAENAAKIADAGAKVLAAYAAPRKNGENPLLASENVADVVRTLGRAAEYWVADPKRMMAAQNAWSSQMLDLWSNTLQRFMGEKNEPLVPPNPADKRFSDPQWTQSPFFDFLRQAHAITSQWAGGLVENNTEIDQKTKAKAGFYLRQLASAASPSNFVATNPELLRETLASDGENLIRGLSMMAEDVEAGHGHLKVRQSDTSKLELGRDMAATPGKVVFRNDLIELIQYAPTTATVFARPVLVVPPWINKYYILDLNPQKSYVKWMAEQGLTVFVISWVNPDGRHADKGFPAYMREGILAALDAIEKDIGAKEVNAIGYCVGGTMLAVTLAYMAAIDDTRIASATFFAAQVDFTNPGELGIFADEATVHSVEEQMEAKGYLDGAMMANAFNMLRPDDLIWSYVVNNYMKGKEPTPFDLLTWNSDSTRMTRANHSFYLRECYMKNSLARGEMVIENVKLDLKKITLPVYSLATVEDHIAPARSVYRGMQLLGSSVRYVLGGSGHIAGVVNPPRYGKYSFWTGGPLSGSFDDWRKGAAETKGSWWPDWLAWIEAQAPAKVMARVPGKGGLPALADAPGDYVRVKS